MKSAAAKQVLFFLMVALGTCAGLTAADFPISAETIVSDARGFGALKLIAASAEVQDELGLDAGSVEKLAALSEEAKNQLGNISRRISRELSDAGESLRGSRALVVVELDGELEKKLEELLTPTVFQKFSRSVVENRLSPQEPAAVVLAEGTAKYLGITQESVENVRNELQQFFAGEGNPSMYRRAAFTKLLESAPAEFRERVVDLVGSRLLPDEQLTNESPPVLNRSLCWDWILSACTEEISPEVFGKNAALSLKLHDLAVKLVAEKNLRWREESKTAFREGRATNVGGLRGEDDRIAADAIRTTLNHGQLVQLSQFGMRSLVAARVREFFADKEVQTFLNDQQTIGVFLKAAERIDKEALGSMESYSHEKLREFIDSLDPKAKLRLKNLVDID